MTSGAASRDLTDRLHGRLTLYSLTRAVPGQIREQAQASGRQGQHNVRSGVQRADPSVTSSDAPTLDRPG